MIEDLVVLVELIIEVAIKLVLISAPLLAVNFSLTAKVLEAVTAPENVLAPAKVCVVVFTKPVALLLAKGIVTLVD